MSSQEAVVQTEHASRYLQQLCKHWSHKFEVKFDPQQGTVSLPDAELFMKAEPSSLHLSLQTREGADAARLRTVVEDHIRRFAFREKLAFQWADEKTAQNAQDG